MSLPQLFAGGRRRLFAWLLTNGLVQAVLGLALVVTFDRFLASGFADLRHAALIGLLAGGLYGSRIVQRRHGEMFALDYVNETRIALLEKVLALPDDARNVRLGLVTARLGADLLALKTWLSDGLAGSIVMAASLGMLLAGAAYLYPSIALILAALVIPWAVAALALRPSLRNAIGEARRRRGKLAAMAGDQVIERLTLAHFGRTRPSLESLARQGQQLSQALVRRATISEALRAASEWALPIASLAMVFLFRDGQAGAAPLLLLLGMAGVNLAGLSRSLDLYLGKSLAVTRLQSILEAPALDQGEAAEPAAIKRGSPVEITLTLADAAGAPRSFKVAPGAVVSLTGGPPERRGDIFAALARLRHDPSVSAVLNGREYLSLALRDWRRIVTLASPRLPLVRTSLRKNLALGAPNGTPESEILDLARAFGLASEASGLDAAIDPARVPVQTALAIRLCRSLLRKPSIILLDEMLPSSEFPVTEAFLALAKQRRVSVITTGGVHGADGRPVGESHCLSA